MEVISYQFLMLHCLVNIENRSSYCLVTNMSYYCLFACLYEKCCNLICWILERGPSIHFHIDGPDRLYGFRSKLKHRVFGKMTEKLSTEAVKN